MLDISCTTLTSDHRADQNPITREKRKLTGHVRTISADIDSIEEAAEGPHVQIAQSPRSEASPLPTIWGPEQEQAVQEEYEADLADHYLYNLMRQFARATRALATYDTQKCIDELNNLPHVHQQSPWVLAMFGRAHYERLNYAAVRSNRRIYARNLDIHLG